MELLKCTSAYWRSRVQLRHGAMNVTWFQLQSSHRFMRRWCSRLRMSDRLSNKSVVDFYFSFIPSHLHIEWHKKSRLTKFEETPHSAVLLAASECVDQLRVSVREWYEVTDKRHWLATQESALNDRGMRNRPTTRTTSSIPLLDLTPRTSPGNSSSPFTWRVMELSSTERNNCCF